MRFKYIATQPDGSLVESELESSSVQEVLGFLAAHGLKPVSVKLIKVSAMGDRLRMFAGHITIGDRIFLSKYLSLMLKIGTSLLQAINILIDDFKKPAVRDFLVEVRANLERGQPFHTAFARHPREFSQVYINLVKAGESSGNLIEVFENLTNSLVKEKNLRDQMRSALVYPVLLLGTSVLILVFLVMFALPKIAKVFLESGFEPPLFSRIVFAVGLFFGQFGAYVLGFGIFGLVVAFYLYKTSLVFQRFLLSVVKEVPVVRDLVRKIAIQRFAATLSSLVKAGLPLTEALEITADAVGDADLRDALLRISREGLAKGLTVGEAFKRETFFPQTVVNLIAISERAGHIDEVLLTLSDFYAGEIDSSLKTLVSFLEPVLLLGIGFIIGFIALAVIIPIYQLTTQF